LDKKFLTNVKVFVEELLSTKSLIKNLKKVNQRHLLCSDFSDFLRNIFQKFSTDHFNLSLSWFDSSAEIHFAKAHKEAYEFYMKNMTKVITNKYLRKYISAFHHVIVFSSWSGLILNCRVYEIKLVFYEWGKGLGSVA